MNFAETKLADAYIVLPDIAEDERGYFARIWCARELKDMGLNGRLAQSSISYNKRKGTLRGMHFQAWPHHEAKLVRCTRGAIFDVIVDLRPESPTFKQWIGMELSEDNHKMLYVPEDCAHGFQTLRDETEVTYYVSEFYEPGAERGFRYDDPAFGISWPYEVVVVSAKDQQWSEFPSDPRALMKVPKAARAKPIKPAGLLSVMTGVDPPTMGSALAMFSCL